ncbi:transporter [Paraconexibacter algicola]|uniref:Transporter n=1 Tax=Paraconexibacter algicola TaxID=2133960 RepID=A0A2T4UKK1_9ACTN|nr:transporter [Paraconexibacter algicola]
MDRQGHQGWCDPLRVPRLRCVPAPSPSSDPRGLALVLGSATAFGGMAVFAKEAYATGLGVLSLLEARFVCAALVFWLVVAVRHRRGTARFAPSRATVQAGLLLGAVGYAAQSGLYFGALTRIDASLVALLLYLHPVIVVLGALATGRETPGARTWAALGAASTGGILVLLGGGVGDLDGLGVTMAVGAALAYATYILCTDRAATDAEPFALSAFITTGAALSFGVAGLASGELDPGAMIGAAGWIVAIALVSTVGAVTLFLAGMARVGPSRASIVSTFEPVVTVGLAMAIYGEALTAVQLAGALLVLSAVVVLNLGPRRAPAQPARTEPDAPHEPTPAPVPVGATA